MSLNLSHSPYQGDEPIATCSIMPSQYLLLHSVQTQAALGHQTLDLKTSGESFVWIMHEAEEISMSWGKKKEMRFVKLAQLICSVLIRRCWQLSRTVMAFFFTAWGLKDFVLCWNTASIRVGGLASVFAPSLAIFYFHYLPLYFIGWIYVAPVLVALCVCAKSMLVDPLQCWHLRRLHFFQVSEATHLISLWLNFLLCCINKIP